MKSNQDQNSNNGHRQDRNGLGRGKILRQTDSFKRSQPAFGHPLLNTFRRQIHEGVVQVSFVFGESDDGNVQFQQAAQQTIRVGDRPVVRDPVIGTAFDLISIDDAVQRL